MAVDLSVYERQRRGINDDYAAQSATNAYSRFLSQQRGARTSADLTRGYGRQTADINRQYARGTQDINRSYGRNTADYTTNYKRQAPSLTGSYGHRGLATGGVQSGIYGRAMQNFKSDYQLQMSRAGEDRTTGLGRLGEDRTTGLKYLGEDQALNISRHGEDVANTNRGYDLSQAQLDAAKNSALSNMEIDRAKEIANAAQYLAALKPQFQ